MAMDGLNLAASVAECRRIVGGRIDKIQQPEKDELAVNLRCGGENLRLLISASPEHCRMQLTNVKKENPIDAPAFCMLLRKRLAGGRVVYIEQPNLDRIVNIGIEAQNDLGDTVTFVLCAEIMGKYSNIILINEQGIVVDAIKRIGIGMSNVRTVLPGQKYEMPPAQDKADPTKASAEDFETAIAGAEGIRIDKALSNAFFGLSPKMAAKLCENATDKRGCGELSPGERRELAEYLRSFYRRLSQGDVTPCVTLNDVGEPEGVLPFVPKEGEYRPAPTMSEALDRFYAETDNLQRMRRHGAGIRKILQNNIERCNKKIALYDEAIASEGDIEKLKLFGELLIANAYRIISGSSEAVVQNYYTDPPENVRIPLDARYSINDNAQRYYKKYQKAKAARDMAALAAAAMDDPTFRRICSSRRVAIGQRTMENHNRLLRQVEGCVGLKTGYTKAAGRTLVSCVERNGCRLIVVTLRDGDDWADHAALYEYGFRLTAPRMAVQRVLERMCRATAAVWNGAIRQEGGGA